MSVLKYLIILIKYKLNIQTPYKISLFIITIKMPFLSSLLISLYYKSIKGVSYTKTDISAGGNYFVDIPIEVSIEVK